MSQCKVPSVLNSSKLLKNLNLMLFLPTELSSHLILMMVLNMKIHSYLFETASLILPLTDNSYCIPQYYSSPHFLVSEH